MDRAARWIATGLSAIALTTLLSGCSEPAEPVAEKPRPVKLFTVTDPGAERIREFPGRLKAPEEAQLSFRLGGELQSLKVHEGQEVKQGELIAQLDDTDYRLKLSDRQANYDLTRSQLTRMEQLVERERSRDEQGIPGQLRQHHRGPAIDVMCVGFPHIQNARDVVGRILIYGNP